MRVIVKCLEIRLDIPCGAGKQHIRWLALAVATRMQRETYPHAFRVPQRVLSSDGTVLKPRAVIKDVLEDGEEVIVELRQGAHVPDEWLYDEESKEWIDQAYGPQSNLMDCKFYWKTGSAQGEEIPQYVRGEYVVSPKWQPIFPQREYGGSFEIGVEPEPMERGAGDNDFDWVATRKGPPGVCNYVFVLKDGTEVPCKLTPDTLTPRGTMHRKDFQWDVPIASDPYPEVDSRPSTASRDGVQDPRFEEDWGALQLQWVDQFVKVRLKDVLVEFHAILVDLFDSYAFMGPECNSTMGMDDWKHLLINCCLLDGQEGGSLPWTQVCSWFEETAGVKDARPYLAQRVTRVQYLELLVRTAGWFMCDHPSGNNAPEEGKPKLPLDEGLFQFITNILIPVMDVYDDDTIRKDAVQTQNLAVIEQCRSAIRLIYTSLCRGEFGVFPVTLKFLFEFALERFEEVESNGGLAPPHGEVDIMGLLSGGDKFGLDDLREVLRVFEGAVSKTTAKHSEAPEQRTLLFWELFEVLMLCSRAVSEGALHEAIPKFVQTASAVLSLVERNEISLPEIALTDDGGDHRGDM